MKHSIAVSVSYGNSENSSYTRTTHMLTFSDVTERLTEETAKQFADGIIAGIVATDMLGVYKEEFPNTVNPNPQIN